MFLCVYKWRTMCTSDVCEQVTWFVCVQVTCLPFQDGGTNSSGTRTKNDDFCGKVFLSNHIELENVGNDFRCMKMDSQILGHVPASREALTIIVILPFFFLSFGFRGSEFGLIWSCWGVLNVPPEMVGMWNFIIWIWSKCHSPKWEILMGSNTRETIDINPWFTTPCLFNGGKYGGPSDTNCY